MITRAEWKNFKALRDLTVDFDRFTVLVGPNGSGKSTVLDGIELASKALYRPSSEVFGTREDLAQLHTHGASTDQLTKIALWVEQGNLSGSIAWTLPVTPPMMGLRARIEERIPPQDTSRPAFTQELMAAYLQHARVYRFNPSVLGRPAFKRGPRPALDADGANLAEVLADRKLKDDEGFRRIVDACRRIVPTLRDVRLDDADVQETRETVLTVNGQRIPQSETVTHAGYEVRLDLVGAPNVPARHASEGTLLALAICTAAMDSRGSPLVLLDEIDRGLHPLAQGALVQQLREATEAYPGLQIIATTHSPDLVDACDAASVRVFKLDPDGHAMVRSLASHPEAQKWLGLLRVGEFWGTVGEDWVTASAPR